MSNVKTVEINLERCNWDDDVGGTISNRVSTSVSDVNDKAMKWKAECEHAVRVLNARIVYRSRASEINGLKA